MSFIKEGAKTAHFLEMISGAMLAKATVERRGQTSLFRGDLGLARGLGDLGDRDGWEVHHQESPPVKGHSR